MQPSFHKMQNPKYDANVEMHNTAMRDAINIRLIGVWLILNTLTLPHI